MLLFLQDSYPENEIFFGQLTDDGAALVASMSKKITPSRYAGDFTMI